MSVSAWLLGLAQIPFIINFFMSMRKGKKVDSNPWEATTLDWAATSSPPLAHGNFQTIPQVHRGPYEYSTPGGKKDFLPQNERMEA
jgi:cytochrome c oxidase subunit 1